MSQAFEENDFNAQFQARERQFRELNTNQEQLQAGQLFQEYSINSKNPGLQSN